MELPVRTTQFGWPGDGGVGEALVGQIIARTKTATCTFKAACSASELEEISSGAGELYTVIDALQRPRCIIRVTDVFETTFGNPDSRLVSGEGDGDDAAAFQADHRIAWQATLPDLPLTDDAILIVEIFELISVL